MVIPTAVVHKKRLAAQPEEAANLDRFDNCFESGCEVIVGRKERIDGRTQLRRAGIELGLEQELCVVALFSKAREAFGEEIGVVLFERAAEGRVLELKQIAGCATGIAFEGKGA
jgi:hypothetical protein